MKGKLLNFVFEGAEVRPVKQAVYELADFWIDSTELTTAQEYITGEEFEEAPEEAQLPNGGSASAAAHAAELQRQLLDRIAELEAKVASQAMASPAVPLMPGGTCSIENEQNLPCLHRSGGDCRCWQAHLLLE